MIYMKYPIEFSSQLYREVKLPSLLYKWRNRGPERVNNVSEFTQTIQVKHGEKGSLSSFEESGWYLYASHPFECTSELHRLGSRYVQAYVVEGKLISSKVLHGHWHTHTLWFILFPAAFAVESDYKNFLGRNKQVLDLKMIQIFMSSFHLPPSPLWLLPKPLKTIILNAFLMSSVSSQPLLQGANPASHQPPKHTPFRDGQD